MKRMGRKGAKLASALSVLEATWEAEMSPVAMVGAGNGPESAEMASRAPQSVLAVSLAGEGTGGRLSGAGERGDGQQGAAERAVSLAMVKGPDWK